ncbi:hypothetical protein ANCCAN_26709 [Ancylostoma caninum]|uniref:Uncharacterized protein n=1 Tax=Ancylostoma caninum TaxID=29170 RepID=A0A368F619_ANCCA|nr:hypothetical protein ANCCAN_26709 [Ancylostoma caninum]
MRHRPTRTDRDFAGDPLEANQPILGQRQMVRPPSLSEAAVSTSSRKAACRTASEGLQRHPFRPDQIR